ncbi:multidrug transporter [Streptomyces sp. ERV7]|uniref:alpha/beta fold hydrolase n=1 Tax=Streptomyces sp. ERV7 TaxID=1322334 RepID=UPI0007F47522|nr:alpha/beta hydrolase [Streptomyces sp. ERV7]OAR27268.1 multidrug transporter [Streptomyces sp. ERV7]
MTAGTNGRVPVVLLHALALDSSMWDAQREALERRGHLVIAPDQRGFGGTPLGDGPPSLDTVADDLARELDGRGIERAVLAGVSMGGYAAMAFLRRHPGRALALALLSTRAEADDEAARTAREGFVALMADPVKGPAAIGSTAPLLVGATTRAERPQVLDRVRSVVAGAAPASLAWAQQAIAARADALDVLRATDIPAVVIVGEEDELVTEADTRAMVEALPQGRLVVVPRSGHLPPLEAPEATRAELDALLGELDSSSAEVGAR